MSISLDSKTDFETAFSNRTVRALHQEGIETLRDLVKYSADRLRYRVIDIGPRSVQEIRDRLRLVGLHLHGDEPKARDTNGVQERLPPEVGPMTHLEAMTKAYWETMAEDDDTLPPWDELTRPVAEHHIHCMRAAVEALRVRNFTLEMLEKVLYWGGYAKPLDRRDPITEFEAVLDAVLEEKP